MYDFLKLIYPSKCLFCRSILQKEEHAYICDWCYHKFIDERGTYLKWLGKNYLDSKDVLSEEKQVQNEEQPIGDLFQVEDLYKERPIAVIPILTYTAEYRKAIIRWKYSGMRRYAEGLAALLLENTDLFDAIHIDAIVPVPLSPRRLRKRGFNQAYDFARAISKRTGVPVIDCLKRNRETKPQTACSKEERYQNLNGAIETIDNFIGTNINSLILVDDIYTTGSTIKACMHAMRENYNLKDTKIYVIVVAKGSF